MSMRFALNLLAYVVPTFAIAYVWHLKIFEATYQQLEIYRADKIIPFGVAAMVVQGAAIAWMYPRLVSNPGSVRAGLGFGFGAALVAWTFTTLAVGAKHRMSSVSRFMVIESAFTVVQFVVVGPLLAMSSRI